MELVLRYYDQTIDGIKTFLKAPKSNVDASESDELVRLGQVSSLLRKTPQTLTSATQIDFDVLKGLNANLVLAHNAVLSFLNISPGDVGNIVIDNSALYSLQLEDSESTPPYVINNGDGEVRLTENGRTIISYYHDGTDINITYGLSYTKP